MLEKMSRVREKCMMDRRIEIVINEWNETQKSRNISYDNNISVQ